MKALSHIQQLENSTEILTPDKKQEELCYKGFAKDGQGNTRLLPITDVESHLDYLRVAGTVSSPQEFALLAEYISKDYTLEFDSPWSPGSRANYYSNRVLGSRGTRGGFELNEDSTVDYMIDLSGEYFEGKTVVDQWRLCMGLKTRFQARATRDDIAIDDPSYSRIPVEEMVKACQDGHNFGFQKVGYHSSGFCAGEQSETYEFGSRESGKFVRIYNHDDEYLRFEAEFKRGYANPIFEDFAQLERPEGMPDSQWEIELQKHLSSIAVGAIDFRDRGNRKDKKRAGVRDSVRLSFYADFLEFLGTNHYRIKLEKPVKSIDRAINWIKRQCAPTLSMMYQGIGGNNFIFWLKNLLNEASERLDNQKELWIKEIKSNPKAYMI